MAWTSTHGSARDGSTSITLSEVVVDDSNKELVFGTDAAADDMVVHVHGIAR